MNDAGNAIVVLLVTIDDQGRAGVELHQAGSLAPREVAAMLRQAAAELEAPRIVLPGQDNGAVT